MRIGISGTHGTGKTTLAQALCAHVPGHVAADEPYWLLEAEGYEFGFPPSAEDYRALLARSVRSLSSPPLLPAVVFDRTPLDYLAYLAATGADLPGQAGTGAERAARRPAGHGPGRAEPGPPLPVLTAWPGSVIRVSPR